MLRAVLAVLCALFCLPAAAQIAVNPVTNRVYVANPASNTVTVINGATGATIANVPVGPEPGYIALNPFTNRIFVNNLGDASLTVIDGPTNTTVNHQIGSRGPITVNPVTGVVFIVRLSDEAFDEVTLFFDSIPNWYSVATMSFAPTAMAINPVTNIYYVAHYAHGHIRAIDGSSTSDHPPSVEIKVFDASVAVAVNPVTNRIYTLQEHELGKIAVINGATNEPTFLAPADHANAPKAVAVNPVTNKIYAAFAGEVVVIDGATNALTFIPSGTAAAGPVAVGIDIALNKVYAPNANGTMTIIDGATNAVTTTPIQSGATSVAVNPVTNKVYVAGGGTVTTYNGTGTRRDMPIDTTITALPGNTGGPTTTITLNASSSFAPVAPEILKVYYQLDNTGPWIAATGDGPYTAQLTGLSNGSHTIRAFAVDAQFAPSVAAHPQSMPMMGDIAAYTFSVGGTEPAASLALSAASFPASEGGSPPSILVNRTGGGSNAVSVRWTTANGSAQSGSDFGTAGSATQLSGTLNWAAGDMEPKAISIPILDDGTVESSESFTVSLSLPTGGAVIGSPSSATINVADNDDAPPPTGATFRLGATSVSVGERSGNTTIQVIREGSLDTAASVSFTTANGTAVAPGDYVSASGAISFPAGVSSRTITIGPVSAAAPYVRVLSDRLTENSESFSVSLTSATGGELGTPTTATVTILGDNFVPPQVQLSSSSASVSEGAGNVTLTVTRSGDSSGAASVDWSTADGTAIAGTDFGAAGNASQLAGTVAWAAGETGARSIVIPIIDDGATEGAKVFSVSLSEPDGATLGTSSANVTINDDETGLAFEQPSYEVSETTTTISLRVTRTGSASTSARVTWAAVNGSAIAGRDYGTTGVSTPPTGTLLWGVGDMAPKTISIRIMNDSLSEGTLGFTVELRSPMGTTISSPGTTQVSILDDDVAPESGFAFSQPKFLVLENGGEATISVTRSALAGGGLSRSASVNYATASSTAMAGSDFTTRSGTLSWGAGEGGTKTFTVPIVNDSTAETPETFRVTLSSPSSGASIPEPDGFVLIVDDDESFPPQGAMPDDWTVPSGASAGWFVSNEPGSYEGAFSLRSEAIGDGEAAQVEVAGNFTGGTVAFRVRVSSEERFDAIRFYVDGTMVREWSGRAITGWQMFTMTLPSGAHTLRWSYEKDGSAALGEDAAWIDAVVLPARTP